MLKASNPPKPNNQLKIQDQWSKMTLARVLGDGGKVPKPNGVIVDSIPGSERVITLCEIIFSS